MLLRTCFVTTIFASITFAPVGCTQPAGRRSAPSTLPAVLLPTKTLPEVAESAKKDVYWFADDAREGRGLGTRGLEQSGDYIAARFKKLGLLPVPSNGGYFASFKFDAGKELGPGTRLSVNGGPVPAGAFTSFVNSKTGDVSGELAFVGYGVNAPDHQYNDYADIDVKGRVVLALRWEPHDEDGKSKWAKDGDYTSNSTINKKAEQAAKAGASALIVVNAPTHHDGVDKLMDSRGGLRRRSTIPVFNVDLETANAMLAAAKAPDLAALQHEIDSTGKPGSRLLDGAAIKGNVEVTPLKNAARNVIAMLPGQGPHADEYVVVGAHYDHVGRGTYGSRGGGGEIHNGADDNASGTSALLQIAEEFALAGRQDRSILFAAFTLEELGLVGSDKFVHNLPVPREKIVGMVNFDMVGRMKNEFLYVGGAGTADGFGSILSAADERSPIELKNLGKGGSGPSDHLSFSKAKIPVLFFYSGSHGDYHTPSDDADKINYTGIAQVTYLAFDVIHSMCAMEKPTYVDTFDNVEPDVDVMAGDLPTTRRVAVVSRSRVALGVEPDYSAELGIKGVLVNAVTPDSAAAAAGLLAKDIIVKLNERKIENLYDLTGFLGDAKPGDVVKVEVQRAAETKTFDATLKARERQ